MGYLNDFVVPTLTRSLTQLKAFLKKGEDYAKEKGMPPEDILNAQLIDDMRGLIFQIQRVSDTVKGALTRFKLVEPASWPDEEKTFADCYARIDKTLELLKSVPKDTYDAGENNVAELTIRGTEMHFPGAQYWIIWAMPNFYFHVSMVYALLRLKGVPVGKMDYIGAPPEEIIVKKGDS